MTSPLLPELVTEGNTVEEALSNVQDALQATLELYQELGRPLPQNVQILDATSPLWFETIVTTS